MQRSANSSDDSPLDEVINPGVHAQHSMCAMLRHHSGNMHVANRAPAPPVVSYRRVATRALHGGPGSGGTDKRLILPGGPGQGAAQQSGERGSRLIIPPGPGGSRGPTANGDAPPPMAPSETFGNFKPPPGFFRDPEAAIVGQAHDDELDADNMLRRISSMSGTAATRSCAWHELSGSWCKPSTV